LREDYCRIFGGAFDAFQGRKTLWQPPMRPGLNFAALLLFVSRLGERNLLAPLASDAVGRWYLYLSWIRCLDMLRRASRLNLRGLVVMGDMQLLESALVQWANRRGLPTATCQHALYMDDGPAVRGDNINTINYLNVVAGNFLAWGSRSQALIAAHAPTRPHVAGNPGIAPGKRTVARDYFYVLTDSSLRFHIYNQRLLQMAQEVSALTGLDYFVRYHPDNDPLVYGSHPSSNPDFPLNDARFAIGHMTSQIYISMRQGVPVYRLESDIPNHPIPPDLLFSSAEELAAKAVPQEVFDTVATEFIAYVGQDAVARYTEVLGAIFPGIA
jgi:hypothetical protein